MQLYTHFDNRAPLPVGGTVRIKFAKKKLNESVCPLLILHHHQLARCIFQIRKQPA